MLPERSTHTIMGPLSLAGLLFRFLAGFSISLLWRKLCRLLVAYLYRKTSYSASSPHSAHSKGNMERMSCPSVTPRMSLFEACSSFIPPPYDTDICSEPSSSAMRPIRFAIRSSCGYLFCTLTTRRYCSKRRVFHCPPIIPHAWKNISFSTSFLLRYSGIVSRFCFKVLLLRSRISSTSCRCCSCLRRSKALLQSSIIFFQTSSSASPPSLPSFSL